MGADAAYYLRVTECIADGAIPEHDLRIFYPPMVFYMLLPLKLILGKTIAYPIYLGFMFMIQLLNAWMIYRLCKHYGNQRFINYFIPLLYLFLSIKLQGEYFFLEPFINFWGLLAIQVYLKSGSSGWIYLFLSGYIVVLAFLTKQFGLAYAAFIAVIILIDNRSSLKIMINRGWIFLLGMLAAFFTFVILFRVGYGVWYDFFYDGRLAFYGEKDILMTLKALGRYFIIAPYLLLLMVPHFFHKIFRANRHLLAWIALILLFSYQFYLNQYDHYYMLVLPPLVMLAGFILNELISWKPFFAVMIILCSLLINEYFIGRNTKSMIFSTDESLSQEMIIAKQLNEVVPHNSNVYLFSNVIYYYLSHLNPAVPEKFGYAYNNILTLDDLEESIAHAEYVVVDKDRQFTDHALINGTVRINDFIKLNELKLYRETDKFLIYKGFKNKK
jgi:hypothetical protein